MKQPLLAAITFLALSLVSPAADLRSVDAFREAAAKANAILTVPEWEKTPEEVESSAKDAIAKANATLDKIGAQDPGKVTFQSTVVALDDMNWEATTVANRAVVIQESSPSADMRSAAEKAIKLLQDWSVGVDYREDVYKAVKAFEQTKPKLTGEDEKLLKETMRDYRRAGLELPPEKRKEVEAMRKELAKLSTDFSTNIADTQAPVVFTKAELEGVPESLLESPGVKTGEDQYTVKANITFHATAIG